MTAGVSVPALGPAEDDGLESARARFRACAASGLLGHAVPAEFGGLGDDFKALVSAHQQLGLQTRDPGLLLAINAHLWGAVFPLLQFATAQQQQHWLPGLIHGDLIGGHAITEPHAGSDTRILRSSAVAIEGGYRLHGHKRFITNAPLADVLVVYARDEGTSQLSAFLITADDAGAEFSTGPVVKGCATATMGDVLLSDCGIPENRLLGKSGGGAIMIQLALERERAFVFAGIAGVMQWQLQQLIQYVRKRSNSEGQLGDMQAVMHRIADMKVRLETTQLWVNECARLLDEGQRITLASAQTKLFASEAFLQSSLDAVHLSGAAGLTGELPGLVDDAMAGRLLSGSSEIQKNIIATMLGLGGKKRGG